MTADMSIPDEVDLLVIGAGGAGMSAAITAAVEGLDVLICEKSDQVGGTSSTTAGTVWIPGNHHDHPDPDSPECRADIEAAETYLRGLLADPDADPGLRRRYLERGRSAIEYLEQNSHVQFAACGTHPDYRSEIEGGVTEGRALAPLTYDGRRLGSDFERVRPPIPEFMIFGGMMIGKADIPRLLNRYRNPLDLLFAARLFLRYLYDRLRYPRGTRLVMGNALMGEMYESLLDRGVEIAFETELVELIREDRAVVGAVVRHGEMTSSIRARHGVVVAAGGFGRNARLRSMLLPEPIAQYSLTAAPNAGEGVSAAEDAGAHVQELGRNRSAFWAPCSIVTDKDGRSHAFPHLAMDRAKPGLVAVDQRGHRFVDESVSYHDFVNALYAHAEANDVPATCHLVVDSRFLRKYGLGIARPGQLSVRGLLKSGYLTRGDSIDDLARACGVDPAGLSETVATVNRYARTGEDLDFHKGTRVLGRFNGDAKHDGPNPCLGPIEQGPFYAVEIVPADLGTSAGIETDGDARALDDGGVPIDGLYVVGNDMASAMRGAYPGPGVSLGPAIVFGHLAAMHAARQRRPVDASG